MEEVGGEGARAGGGSQGGGTAGPNAPADGRAGRSHAARAGLWSTIDIGVRQALQFVTSIILARLLAPADFGVIALVLFFSGFSAVFVQGGLSEALIQRQVTTREEESSVFWWNVASSLLFAVVLVAIGPFLASFYKAPVMAGLMVAAAVQMIAASLGGVQVTLLTRELRFERLAKVGLIASATGAVTAVVAAWAGAGIWALAAQITVNALVGTAMVWRISDWRPIRHFRLRTIRHLVDFGVWLSLSTALEIMYTQGFGLLLGKLYGLAELGLYNRAANTQQLPTSMFSAVIARVAFPLLSTRSQDPGAMRAGLRKANRLTMLLNVPALVGLALVPDLVIQTLFGAKWTPAAPILSILAWSGVIFPLHVLNLQAILSQGRTRTYFQVEMIKKAVGLTAVIVGSFYGVFGLASSQLAMAVIALVINVEPVRRTLGYGVVAQLKDIAGVIGATAAMAAVVLGLRHAVTLPAPAELALVVPAGAASYLLAGFVLAGDHFGDAFAMARAVVKRVDA